MFKAFKQLFTGTPEQTYLAERLQSAKWLGWDMDAKPAPQRKPGEAPSPVVNPANGKPA